MKREWNVICIVLVMAVYISAFSGFADAKIVEMTNTTDSKMRPYMETIIGDAPSPGYYAYWSVYVRSVDQPGWATLVFHFDNKPKSVKIYVTPYTKKYVYAVGYMNSFTNSVDVTLE